MNKYRRASDVARDIADEQIHFVKEIKKVPN